MGEHMRFWNLLHMRKNLQQINAYVGVSSATRYLNFGLSLHLNPYFGYAGNEGSGESAHLCRLH